MLFKILGFKPFDKNFFPVNSTKQKAKQLKVNVNNIIAPELPKLFK